MASLQLEAHLPPDMNLPKDATVVTDIEKGSTSSISSSNAVAADDEWVYPYPTEFKLTEKPIDEIRELKVAVIGAGLRGITAAILLQGEN